jgi:hypothetical protein
LLDICRVFRYEEPGQKAGKTFVKVTLFKSKFFPTKIPFSKIQKKKLAEKNLLGKFYFNDVKKKTISVLRNKRTIPFADMMLY